MIDIKELTISYGGPPVLQKCSLSIPAGARAALMGPSGCGKTTLINAAAGLIKPDGGSISVDGRVSYVFQEPALFPWLTALKNVNVVLGDRRDTLPIAAEWLRELELDSSASKYPHELSGGQKQRVAICRALAYGGDVLLLDEPLKGLDPALRGKTAALILRESRGKTVLLVTHDATEARALCDTVYRYRDGTFVRTPDDAID